MTMSRPRTYALAAVLVVAAILTLALAASAEPTAANEISRYTVDGGGGTSTGGAYTLDGTMGQYDAGSQSGGVYGLAGGIWDRLASALYRVFLPLVKR